MFTRTLTILATAMVLQSGSVSSQQPTVFSQPSTETQSSPVVLNMSGDLAGKYAQIAGPIDGDEDLGGLIISTTAVMAQRLENDKLRIEHSAQVTTEGRPDRLVTLTATVAKTSIRSLVRTVLEGDFTYFNSRAARDAGESPAVSARHLSVPFLSLADLKGIKLRCWTLESEIGE